MHFSVELINMWGLFSPTLLVCLYLWQDDSISGIVVMKEHVSLCTAVAQSVFLNRFWTTRRSVAQINIRLLLPSKIL